MLKLQSVIESQHKNFYNVDKEEKIENLNEVIKVYDQLAASRESAIDMQALLRLFFSLIIPILSFAGVVIEVGSKLSNYLKASTSSLK